MARRIISNMLVLALVFSSVPLYAQQDTPAGFLRLNEVELALYGEVGTGSIVPRLERAEIDVFGKVQSDGSSLLVRVDRLAQMFSPSRSGASLMLQLNAIEWMTFQRVNPSEFVVRRIEAIERAFYGELMKSPLNERVDNLTRELWGKAQINVVEQGVPQETVVKIRLDTEVSSAKMSVDDVVRYRVADTVILDNSVVIPAGAQGQGRVVEVRTAGAFGREGQVVIDWGTVSAMDGTSVRLTLGEKSQARTEGSPELAAGAAVAGIILLSNPIGLAAGALVTGKNQVLPVGTQLFAEVAEARTIRALSLVPVF